MRIRVLSLEEFRRRQRPMTFVDGEPERKRPKSAVSIWLPNYGKTRRYIDELGNEQIEEWNDRLHALIHAPRIASRMTVEEIR